MVGQLPHPELTSAHLELVTMWQSLEHLPPPLEALQGRHRLLAPGRRLMASVPNIESGPFRWFGPAWYGVELPRHLIHFSPGSPCGGCSEAAGFTVEKLRMIPKSDWLRASAGLASERKRATLVSEDSSALSEALGGLAPLAAAERIGRPLLPAHRPVGLPAGDWKERSWKLGAGNEHRPSNS